MQPYPPTRDAPSLGMILLLMPSTHGLISWAIWWGLYSLKLVEWYPTTTAATVAFGYVLVAYALASAAFLGPFRVLASHYAAQVQAWKRSETPLHEWRYILALHALGFLGIALYIRDFASALGGLSNFFTALLTASHLIRWQAEQTVSIGTQLSYFGWVAIALTVFELRRGGVNRAWIAVTALQVAGNFLFIDRTRPIWILYTGFLLYSLGGAQRRLILRALSFAVVSFVLFIGIALWVGKIGYRPGSELTILSSVLRVIYFYGTGSFAYFNHVVQLEYPADGAFARSFYPIFRFTSALGLTEVPPSQINDFYWVPVPTNVGTFLEPLYRDGGWAWVAIGVLIHSFGFNALAVLLLGSARPLALFAWANLCFVTFIGFFTPKFNNLPVWLFTGIGVASMIAAAASFRATSTAAADPAAPLPGGRTRDTSATDAGSVITFSETDRA